MMKSDLISIITLLMLINVNVGQEAGDYSYDDGDYEEIPKAPATTASLLIATTTEKSLIGATDESDNSVFDEERRKAENDVIKTQLDTMSNTFRKIITKIKMKHKRIDMVFLVDASSSVGKENFENEIGFVKRLLSDFNVSFNYTRVGLITFSSRSKIVSVCGAICC
jgi:Mg-chelatase subunit ChlD